MEREKLIPALIGGSVGEYEEARTIVADGLIDTERLDKIERMAKASGNGLIRTFHVTAEGELVTLGRFEDEKPDEEYYATVREAIDNATEAK